MNYKTPSESRCRMNNSITTTSTNKLKPSKEEKLIVPQKDQSPKIKNDVR